jgi:hypothetical protein
LSRIKDTHLTRPAIRGYGELGRAKGLRAVNSGALKVVDALESAGAIRPRQAVKARIGILSADAYDTMPKFVYAKKPTVQENTTPELRRIYGQTPASIRRKINDISSVDAYGKKRDFGNQEDMSNPKRESRYLVDMFGKQKYFQRLHYKKLDQFDKTINELIDSGASQKEVWEAQDKLRSELTNPTMRRMFRMGDAEQDAIPKLRASYQSLRNKAGLGLLAGAGAGGIMLAMANRKKESSSGSDKVNKSMAKRATMQKGRFTELARSLGSRAVRGAKQVMRADPIGMIKDAYVPHIANSLPLRLKRHFQAGQIALEDKAARKIVDTLERSQIITPKQALRARLGIEQSQKNTRHSWLRYPLTNQRQIFESEGFDTYRKLTGKDLRARRNDQSERAMEDLQNQTWEEMPQWRKNDYKLTGGRPRVSEDLAESFHERFKHDKLGRKLTNAVNELSDTYNDVRFGLRRGALIGGLGLGALALSNRKKENTPSSSGRVNKSMAKRATPTKAQSPSNKYL